MVCRAIEIEENEKSVVFTKRHKKIDDQTIECEVCDDFPKVYHRTTLRGLRAIAANGGIKPQKTGVVSLSASPRHTFGGAIRLTFDRKDVPETEPMCYAEGEDARTALEVRDRIAQETRRDLNAIDAELGVSPGAYRGECEQMAREPVDIRKARMIEFFVHQQPEVAEDVNPSCERRIPHYIDGSGWSGKRWEDQLKLIDEARTLAGELGIRFKVRSCFGVIQLDWRDVIPLDDDNLNRLTEGVAPRVERFLTIKDADRLRLEEKYPCWC